MGKYFFYFFNPSTDFLAWRDELNGYIIIVLFLSLVLSLFYYFVVGYNIAKNRQYFWMTGIIGAILISLGFLTYLQLAKPIASITKVDTFIIIIHILLQVILFYFVYSFLRYVFSNFKSLNNNYYHKKNIPF